MHYRNGRAAKNGDRVVVVDAEGKPRLVGFLYEATAGNNYCNGRLALITPNDPCPNLRECLHADDLSATPDPKL